MPPNYYDVIGNTIQPLPTGGQFYYQGQKAERSHNALADPQGNLQFFIVDDEVFYSDGMKIGDLISASTGPPVTQEVVVVPVPQQSDKYYIIYSNLGIILGNFQNGHVIHKSNPWYVELGSFLPRFLPLDFKEKEPHYQNPDTAFSYCI